MPKASLLDRIIPPWGWLWRVKDSVFPRRRINFDTAFVDSKLTPESLLADLSLGDSVFATNGLQVWLIGEDNLITLRRRLAQNSKKHSLRIDTADGIRSGISMTDSVSIDGNPCVAGSKIDLMPVVGRNSTDLFAILSSSEIFTNHTISH